MAWLDFCGNSPGFGNSRAGVLDGGGTSQPLFTSINNNGWSAEYSTPPPRFDPDLNPVVFSVSRDGYDPLGNPVTHNDVLTVTSRVRKPYPDHADHTAAGVALSDYILSADRVAGVVNASLEISPKPIANWAMLDRDLVGDTLRLEVTGNHWFARNGKPFACVEFSASDGNTTIRATATALEVSEHLGDKCAVLVYKATLDISTLSNGLVIANAAVYPWIGTAASVLDSATHSTKDYEFSPRYFWKDTARLQGPPLVYVASAGDDATGIVSTDAAAAKAKPCMTVNGAIAKLRATTAVTGGYIDGCHIRIMDTVGFGSAIVTTHFQKCGAAIIERDPHVSKSVAVIDMSTSFSPKAGGNLLASPLATIALRFRDLTILRSGASTFTGTTGLPRLQIQLADDLAFDNNNVSFPFLGSGTDLWQDGVTYTNATAGSVMNASSNFALKLSRGVSVDRNFQPTDCYTMLGCIITRPANVGNASVRPEHGTVIQFNKFNVVADTTGIAGPGNSSLVTGYSFSQNLVEICHITASAPSLRASSDSPQYGLTNVLFDNNTVTGYGVAGRFNAFYDEGPTRRTHKFCRVKNSIISNMYTKSDRFRGEVESGADASVATGNWPFMYGVGCHGNFTQFVNPGANQEGDSQGPEFKGLGTILGDSLTIRNDPLFNDYRGSTASPGAGGGDYTLRSGSPCLNMAAAAQEGFAYDLSGTPRNRGSVGAYS